MGDSFILQPKNVDVLPKARKLSFRKKFRNYFKEYCDATGFHGFRYIAETRSIFEKVLWILAILFSIAVCAMYIIEAYVKWDQSPVIVSFANKGMPIYEIPYPSITICAESKLRANVTNLKEVYIRAISGGNLTEKELKYLGYLGSVCPLPGGDEDDTVEKLENFDDFLEIIEEVSPKFEFTDCKFLGTDSDCEMFVPIITDEGICYTFNFLNRSDIYKDNVVHFGDYHVVDEEKITQWDTDSGYSKSAGVGAYPMRALLAGARYQFSFNVKIRLRDVDKFCRQSVEGFRILFHAPIRIPRLSFQYIRIPFDKTVMAAIEPKMITTSESVKNYSPQKRMCYFPGEKYLKFFKIYSANNCALECMANMTLHICKCVSFYMPRENGTRICSLRDVECVQMAEYALQIAKLVRNIKNAEDQEIIEDMSEEEDEMLSTCDCLPMCTDIEYRVGISQADWDWKEEIASNAENNETQDFDYHITKISTYFMSGTFIASERNELYGLADLLANFGGLVGLFTGFSFLSLLEIIYFLSVRLICNVRMHRNWAGITRT